MHLTIGDTVTVTIQSIGKNGEGIASYQGLTLYVENALPNEIVKIIINECHKTYAKAEILEIIHGSPFRTLPYCPLFGKCGGCQIMHLQYQAQLQLKQLKVQNAFRQFSLECDVAPCLPSPQQFSYRNKIQMPVEGSIVGLYAKSSHELIDINSCPVHCDLGDEVFQKIKPYLHAPIRHILIKTSIHLRETIVTLVVAEENRGLSNLASEIMNASPHIKGVILNINPANTNVILGKEYRILKGSFAIVEKLHDLSFQISPASFFQVNTLQAEQLYQKALQLAELNGEEIVLDAFCGVGTITLFFARHVKKIIGVESVPEAIVDAKKNAHLNGIKNADFVCDLAEKFIQNTAPPDLLILNPPRKGCAESLLRAIKRLLPRKILYISCEPQTLARDIAFLNDYKINTVQPFDMFPQTTHVETIAKLEL